MPSFSSANEKSNQDDKPIYIQSIDEEQSLTDCKKLLAECASLNKRQQQKLEDFQVERQIREEIIQTQQTALDEEEKLTKKLKTAVFWETFGLTLLAILKFGALL